jgi:Phage integrase, N-terminal SAM-like domain
MFEKNRQVWTTTGGLQADRRMPCGCLDAITPRDFADAAVVAWYEDRCPCASSPRDVFLPLHSGANTRPVPPTGHPEPVPGPPATLASPAASKGEAPGSIGSLRFPSSGGQTARGREAYSGIRSLVDGPSPGDVAQWLEHLLCTQGVVGSSPIVSTNHKRAAQRAYGGWRAPGLAASCALRARSLNNISRMHRRHFGSVRKLPSGRWQASYWHDGRRHVATETVRAKGDALAWLATKEADIVRGTWVAPPTGKVTFGDYSSIWLQRQGHLRPRTRELYEFLLRKHIGPTFGSRSLTTIANSAVVAWYRGLSARVPGTAPKCFRLPHQIMAAAVADGYLVKSPVVIKGASRERVEEQAIPTPAELDALAEAVAPRYRAMIWLAGACGLRFGELAALRRDRVDLLHKEVRVAETITELVGGGASQGRPRPNRADELWPFPRSSSQSSRNTWRRSARNLRPCFSPHRKGATSRGTISANVCGCPLLPLPGLTIGFTTCATRR